MSYSKTVNISIDKLTDDVLKKAMNGLEEICLVVEADAKLNCPVLTGTLRRSITHTVTKDTKDIITGTVGTNVEYAYWVDRKKPYLSYSVDKNVENMKRIMTKHLSK